MSRLASMPYLLACLSLAVAGCADNAMVLKGKLSQVEQQQTAMTRQNQELQNRITTLSRDNEDKDILLTQARQQTIVSEDQLTALRDQLRGVTSQLAQVRVEKESTDKRVQVLTASMQRQGGVTINPNNSLLQTRPAMNIPGAVVRADGDVVRVELPGNTLFEPGTARFRPGAIELITAAAAEIARVYPDQIVGVEGHTDNDPTPGGQVQNNHKLSADRAMAVCDVLTTRTRLQGNQLFVMGRGSINPIVSNAFPEGKQRNRRVELVIYPERKR